MERKGGKVVRKEGRDVRKPEGSEERKGRKEDKGEMDGSEDIKERNRGQGLEEWKGGQIKKGKRKRKVARRGYIISRYHKR